jgi:serine/threonine protein kinase
MQDWKALELFEREAKVLENLHHPAIPRYFNHFQIDTPSDRKFYLVQELAVGESLANLVEQGWKVSETGVQQIAGEVLQILVYLHSLTPPVIHRDIKPQNLILHRGNHISLVDFSSVQAAYRSILTAGSTVVGTFGYMPPEIFQGKAVFASDLYSLGATLVFLLTRRSPADLPQKRLKLDFRSQTQISESFGAWLDKLLAPAVEDRFQSAAQALQALNDLSIQSIQPKTIKNSVVIEPTSQRATSRGNSGYNRRIQVYRDPEKLIIKILPRYDLYARPGKPIINRELASTKQQSQELSALGELVSCIFFVLFLIIFFPLLILGTIIIDSVFSGDTDSLTKAAAEFFHDLAPYLLSFLVLFIFTLSASIPDVLEINPDHFKIQVKLLCFKKAYIGKTSHINRVELRGVTNKLLLHEGIEECSFGGSVTRGEREWLANEIIDFLSELRQ